MLDVRDDPGLDNINLTFSSKKTNVWKKVIPRLVFFHLSNQQHGRGGGAHVQPELQPIFKIFKIKSCVKDPSVFKSKQKNICSSRSWSFETASCKDHSEHVLVFASLLLSLLLKSSRAIYCVKPESPKVQSKMRTEAVKFSGDSVHIMQ